jgi:2,4-dienoyl-CoA reductase-like NADH-dependent reductase (Old Yellow Enzyme family)
MPTLFDPLTINQLQLSNRFVRSATYDNLANQGMMSDAQLNLYDTLSRGEIGLIISAGIYPTKDGIGGGGQLSAENDDAIPSLAKLTRAVH